MWVEDLENCMRMNNVHIVGLPGKTEGGDPTEFIEGWLLDIFGKDAFTPHFSVERAHCTPTRPQPPGNPPRPVLPHLLNYHDKENILRLACERHNIQYDGVRISFYLDFSAEVQRNRAKFTEVCKHLQCLQASYAMLYPARRCITSGRQAHVFDSAAAASDWIDTHEADLRCQSNVVPAHVFCWIATVK